MKQQKFNRLEKLALKNKKAGKTVNCPACKSKIRRNFCISCGWVCDKSNLEKS